MEYVSVRQYVENRKNKRGGGDEDETIDEFLNRFHSQKIGNDEPYSHKEPGEHRKPEPYVKPKLTDTAQTDDKSTNDELTLEDVADRIVGAVEEIDPFADAINEYYIHH